MTYRVLVTPRSFCNLPGAHHDYLREHGCEVVLRAGEHPHDAAALREQIGGFEGVILGLDQFDASVFEAADSLRAISRFGVGVDAVDMAAAREHGVTVTNTPNTNHLAVAELTIGLLFALARGIVPAAAGARAGIFRRTTGWELAGKTLGVVGYGAIGREVTQRGLALGMRVLAYDPYWQGDWAGAEPADLATIWREARAVTLHVPLTEATTHLVDAAAIGQMQPGTVVINTARGGLVDEAALYDGLISQHLGGAAIDTFAEEPPYGNPLLTLDNFIATPHMGGATREAVLRTGLLAAQNLVAVLNGEPCACIVI